MASRKQPNEVMIRSYQVGFGDCFLLTFVYPGDDARHVLIDFGTTKKPAHAPSKHMLHVAQDIRDTVAGGRFVAVVATHRHQDHISGFAGASGRIIHDLEPDVVLQPWTEHPDAEIDARTAAGVEVRNLTPLHTLTNMHHVASQAVQVAKKLRAHDPARSEQLSFLGEDNLKNAKAVRALMDLGKKRRYLREGKSAGLGRLLPGVKVHVLGPPSLTQTERIREQTDTNADEFWQLQAVAGDYAEDPLTELFPGAARGRVPAHARWFRDRLLDLRLDQMLELVRVLDDAMNNTSLILLFESRGSYFLFPGDAQWENWEHALGKEKYRKLLEKVHLYKVGHHGSRNATPRSLWRLFEHRSETRTSDRLTSMMSTLVGKHGHEESHTEVPRESLVREMAAKSDLLDTQDLAPDEICHEVHYPLV